MALSVLMPLVYCCVYNCVPESPRFLVTKGRDAEALSVIERLSVQGDPSPAVALAAIKESLRQSNGQNLSWYDRACTPNRLPECAARERTLVTSFAATAATVLCARC